MNQIAIPGVLGGMGPEATIDFMSRLLRKTPAKTDQDHLHVLIDHNPQIPNRHAAIAGNGEPAAPPLAAMARRLERAGADFLVMVCNTAHAFQTDIQAAVSIPFLSIIDMVLADLDEDYPGVLKVGVMAADGCLDAQLYQRGLSKTGRDCILWSDTERQGFMKSMYSIKSGVRNERVREQILALGNALQERGAEVLISGCTEIPLVTEPCDFTVPVLSSTDILVQHTMQYAEGIRKL